MAPASRQFSTGRVWLGLCLVLAALPAHAADAADAVNLVWRQAGITSKLTGHRQLRALAGGQGASGETIVARAACPPDRAPMWIWW